MKIYSNKKGVPPFLFDIGITRAHMLPAFFSSYIILSGQGQYTPDKLTNPKRLLLGGAYSVRGYPESDAGGDYGFNTTAELRTPCFIIPGTIKLKNGRLKDLFQMAFFTDMGTVYNHGGKESFLAGSGLGLRMTAGRDFTGRIDFAWPMGVKAVDEESNDFQAHFSLSVNY